MRRKALALASAGAVCGLLGFVSAGCNKGTEGMEVFEATLAPDGPALSWWVTELDTYHGFLVHRAAEGGPEALVTPEPLTLPGARVPAAMRWRDPGSASSAATP